MFQDAASPKIFKSQKAVIKRSKKLDTFCLCRAHEHELDGILEKKKSYFGSVQWLWGENFGGSYTGVLICPWPDQEGNKLMFLSEWREFPSTPYLARKTTWWQLAARCCWNRARPWHASELISFLVGLRIYQYCNVFRDRRRRSAFLSVSASRSLGGRLAGRMQQCTFNWHCERRSRAETSPIARQLVGQWKSGSISF